LAEQLRHIVGLELHIERLEGKRKLNQHHGEADREGAIRGLEAAGQTALARAMREAGG
jgi:transcriptional regulator